MVAVILKNGVRPPPHEERDWQRSSLARSPCVLMSLRAAVFPTRSRRPGRKRPSDGGVPAAPPSIDGCVATADPDKNVRPPDKNVRRQIQSHALNGLSSE